VKNPGQATPTQASGLEWKERQWEQYEQDKGKTVYYFEKDSLSYPSPHIIHVWRKRTFPTRSSSHKEIVSFDEIDCKNDKYRSLEVQALNWDDTPTPIYRKPSPWTNIYQDTPDEYFLDNFCRRSAGPGGR
jgi:hypothetical protein